MRYIRALRLGSSLVLRVACLVLLGALLGLQASAQDAAPVEEPALFEMRSGFWLNLHHVLYREARKARPPAVVEAEGGDEPDLLPEAASDGEREAWTRSIGHYRRRMVDRDLLFDPSMVELGNRLGALGDRALPSDLPYSLSSVLADAAPAYRKHLWEQDDAANRAWEEALQPMLAIHGEPLVVELEKVLGRSLPARPVPVDLSAWAGWAGAYATLEPMRLTISSTDERNQGAVALEVLLHETAHGVIDGIRLAIERERQEQKVKLEGRGRLWHAILFDTAGALVARRLDDYEPYAVREGLWERGAWPDFRRVIDAHWRPYLEGRLPLATAIERMVSDLARTAP